MSMIRGHRFSDELRDIYEQFSREDREQLDADIKTVLATGPGRRVLMAILWKEHVFGTIGENGEHQTQVMIEVGRHNLAQDILGMANQADCAAVALATNERNEILKERNQRIEQIKSKIEGAVK